MFSPHFYLYIIKMKGDFAVGGETAKESVRTLKLIERMNENEWNY